MFSARRRVLLQTICIRYDDAIRPNTNRLFGPLFGTEANTNRIFGTSLLHTNSADNWLSLCDWCVNEETHYGIITFNIHDSILHSVRVVNEKGWERRGVAWTWSQSYSWVLWSCCCSWRKPRDFGRGDITGRWLMHTGSTISEGSTVTAANSDHDGHKQWPWRPQTVTMTATNSDHHGHKQWPSRPQTILWQPQWRPKT